MQEYFAKSIIFMRIWFPALSIIFMAGTAWGQQRELKQVQKIGIEMSKNMSFNSNDRTLVDEKSISGTPYLDNNFRESYILKVNGVELKDMRLRYNIYSDNMEFRKDGQTFVVAFPSEIHRIKTGGKNFVYAQYVSQGKIDHGYFEVLHEGDYQLLKKYVTTLKISEKRDSEDSLRFVRQSPVYYFRRGEGRIYPILTQKQLTKIIQPVHQSVIDFIKANKINGKDELKLIRLMEFLEESEN